MNEKKKEFILQINNYLRKAVTLGINCYEIRFSGDKLRRKDRLEFYLNNGIDLLKYNIENLEFIIGFSILYRGKIIVEIIVGIRPLITPQISGKVVYANLSELFMLYDNINVFWIKTTEEISKIDLKKYINVIKPNHKIISFSDEWFQLMADLSDFTYGNFEINEFYTEIDKYSCVGANFYPKFDEYSLYKLLDIYLKFNNMYITDGKIFDKKTNKILIENLYKFICIENRFSDFFKDNFYSQTNLLDVKTLFERNYKQLLSILLLCEKDEINENGRQI